MKIDYNRQMINHTTYDIQLIKGYVILATVSIILTCCKTK